MWYVLDDILIASSTEEEHLATLDEVLSRLEKYGVVVNQSKCEVSNLQCGISGSSHR